MNRRLVYNWGINDADYPVNPRGQDGKRHMCPIYRGWQGMIERCHSPQTQLKQPTYVGCQIDERWRSFMAFRTWYLEQAPKLSDHLDKDFLGDGKLYSLETCCFVPQWLNNLFTDSGAKRGKWPQGVYYHKLHRKFGAQIICKSKQIHLGYFDTPEEASAVYLKAKAAYVEELLIEFSQPPRLAVAIRQKMTELIQKEQALWGTYMTEAIEQRVTNTSSQMYAP